MLVVPAEIRGASSAGSKTSHCGLGWGGSYGSYQSRESECAEHLRQEDC